MDWRPRRRALASLRLTAVSGLLLMAIVAVPAAQARTSCSHAGPPTNELTVRTSGMAAAEIRRAGDEIVVGEFAGGRSECTGQVATVFNTDVIKVVARGVPSVDIELSGGPLAPGATPEPDAAPEIEIQLRGRSLLGAVIGTPRGDVLSWAPGGALPGLNLNPGAGRTDRDFGDADVDVTVMGESSFLVARGGGGNDQIAPASFYTAGGPVRADGDRGNDILQAPFRQPGVLNGGSGNDVITGSGQGDRLHGGPGHDVVYARGGDDRIRGGPGTDRLVGGRGNDTIDALDSQGERIGCGPGRDQVTADPVDRLSGCELITRRP